MNIKKLGLVLILVLTLSLSLGSAYEQDVIFKQGEEANLRVVCTNNGSLCNPTTLGNATVISPSGITLYDNFAMTKEGATYNVTLNVNDTLELGEYLFVPTFTDGGTTFSKGLVFTVTPSGTIPSTAQGLIYVILMVLASALTLITFFGATAISGANEMFNGKLIKINFKKHLKVFLYFLSYIFLTTTVSLTYVTSAHFLFMEGFKDILYTFMYVLWVGAIPIFFLGMIIITLNWFDDMRRKAWSDRNLPFRSGRRW